MDQEQGPGINVEDWHIRRTTPNEISRRWKPVLMYRNNCLAGIGTLFKNISGSSRIVTAGHLFGKEYGPSEWTYRPMRPMVDYRLPILAAGKLLGAGEHDIAICQPGEHSLPRIPSFFKEGAGCQGYKQENFTPWTSLPPLTSLVTGNTFPWIGIIQRTDGTQMAVIAATTFPGESGTGFIGTSNDEIYVLKGCCPVPQLVKEVCKLTDDVTNLSFVIMLKFLS